MNLVHTLGVRFFLLFLLFGLALGATAQSKSQEIDKSSMLIKFFEKGDAEELLPYLAPLVELDLPSKSGVFGQKQCVLILQEFFKEHLPKTFTIIHSGESEDQSSFFIGQYLSLAGKEFRVSIFLHQSKKNSLIQEIGLVP